MLTNYYNCSNIGLSQSVYSNEVVWVSDSADRRTGPFGPLRGRSSSFWGLVMIGVGGLWLLVKLLPFILGFVVPALLVYGGYMLISKSWCRAD